MTRRRLLGAGAVLGAGLGAGALLAGCGGSGPEGAGAAGPSGPTGPPQGGGTLRVGALGKAAAITRDPHGTQSNESDYLIIALTYDPLTVPGSPQTVAPRLAAKWEPSADLRRHRFVLADGARFHNGAPVTAADVAWSLRRLRGTPSGAARLPGVQPGGIAEDGTNAVVLTSDYPNADLPLLLRLTTFVLPRDTPDAAINAGSVPGTGPFRLESYNAGNARLVRNADWYGGAPLLDAIEVRIFTDPQAMANALFTGEIDVASNVGPVAARTAAGRDGVQVVRRPNDSALPLVMRVADGPFAEPRVREALRLAVDRDALVAQALSGYGTVANDVLGTGDPQYARDLPQRRRDLDRARSLLDAAGFDRAARYPLVTCEEAPGQGEAATLIATQLREVGVNVDVVRQDQGTFYDQTWLKAPLYTAYWGTNDSVTFFAGKTMASGAGQNEAGQADPEFDAAYQRAVAFPDAAARAGALRELQRMEYERSGYLLWGMADGVDLATAKVGGLPRLAGYGRVQLERTWLAA
ncbi:ABC transporter substrate-binding protein [Pseudonocardia acaciae]|uniref:ABC transporter substrate-binding protein n=1 Tax=Pseudonocardia acaciae TaxID=551276 RepID=UPI00055DB74F|nr:ABC transporter substrate-binding protein [Pseudonocardia acaciae]